MGIFHRKRVGMIRHSFGVVDVVINEKFSFLSIQIGDMK